MKKTCKIVGRDGKGNGRAGRVSGVSKALKQYLDRKMPEALSYAFGLCRDKVEASELVQEACYRALKAKDLYKPGGPMRDWLFAILRNAFMDSRRCPARRRNSSLDFLSEDREPCFLYELISDGQEAMLTTLIRRETSRRVRDVLARMKRTERAALTLRDTEGLGYDAMARALRVPVGTVRSRVFRARRKFHRLATRLDLV